MKPILKAEEIIEARKVVRQVYLDEKIERYIVDIVFATRYPEKYDLKELKIKTVWCQEDLTWWLSQN